LQVGATFALSFQKLASVYLIERAAEGGIDIKTKEYRLQKKCGKISYTNQGKTLRKLRF
jgi:hypothetical protein